MALEHALQTEEEFSSPESLRIPVNVLTGFLGSGKTTLLSHLIRHPAMDRTVIIINEFGEVGIDHLLLTKPKEDMVLLSNGCLCCAIRGDLVNTLTSLLQERADSEIPNFNRVVIETSGLADPIPILLTVVTDEDLTLHYALDGVIAVIDAVQGIDQLEQHPQVAKQIMAADRLLVSKTDIASEERKDRLVAQLKRLNPGARILETVNGRIGIGALFDVHPGMRQYDPEKVTSWLDFSHGSGAGADSGSCDHREHEHDHAREPTDSGHDHLNGIHSFSLYYEGLITPDGLQVWMDTIGVMRGPDLLRIKGLLNIGGRPVVIQAVQHLFHPPVELEEWPDAERRSRFVFITKGIERSEIEKTLAALDLRQTAEAGFDVANYQRFVEAMVAAR
jgi:G3E family GTPase